MRNLTPFSEGINELSNCTLRLSKMKVLEDLGLSNNSERMFKHMSVGYNVAELFMILPTALFDKDNNMFCIEFYKTAFDVPAIRYYSYKLNKELDNSAFVLDDCKSMANMCYELLLWVNKNYPESLDNFKKLVNEYNIEQDLKKYE